ncbi:hypothetical protein PsYK624_168790 [Phanerochaete sordida]|uniref:Uncharacterized protein n=1 Tax=Phanerochaete sordida TaxID=48140 RepID=A0A9P3LMM7_9APHY|nr:hypothetical protein PsYK624_168790 [Phanerochaete sordida]
MHKQVQKIRAICRKRSTIRLARSYVFVLPDAQPHAEFACAYLASMHLKNCDVFASRTATRGGLMPKAFWRLVLDVERALQHAARTGAALPSGRAFTYKRLPRHKPRCAACDRAGLPCLVRRRHPSDKCEVCCVRKGKCERDETKQVSLSPARQSPDEELDIEITGWRLGGGPLQDGNGLISTGDVYPPVDAEAIPAVNTEHSPEGVSRSRSPSPDGVPLRELVKSGKAQERPAVITPAIPAAPSSRALGKRRAPEPPEDESPPSKRRPSDAHAAPFSAAGASTSTDNGTHPRCVASSSRTPAAPTAPAAPAASGDPSDSPGQYLKLAHEKAVTIVQLVASLGGAVPVEIRVPVTEMREGLKDLGGGLADLQGEALRAACLLMEVAVVDVVALDEASIANVKLRSMVRCLKSRISDLAAA